MALVFLFIDTKKKRMDAKQHSIHHFLSYQLAISLMNFIRTKRTSSS
mgnify:CR=1 FL=1